MATLRKTISKFKHVLKDSALEITSPIAFHDARNGQKKENGKRGSRESKREKRLKEREDSEEERELAKFDAEEKLRLQRQRSDALAAQTESPEVRARYGTIEMQEGEYRLEIRTLSEKNVGEKVTFRARIHTIRKLSSMLAFLVFRQQTVTLQGVLQEYDSVITRHMVRWIERIPSEAIVIVSGVVQKPAEDIVGATIHDIEISIESLHVLARPVKILPFTVYQAEEEELKHKEETEEEEYHLKITERTRLSNRLLDLRTPTSQSIFRINASICDIFRSTLNSQRFLEIHTPKLQPAATESGSSVFEVKYFNRSAFLAQSPQLAKQMCLAADFDRVYEIGPVFRAENSNTHRHSTEYVGLDLEMALQEDYHEALNLIDNMLKNVFKGIYERHRTEIDIIKRRYPHEDLVWLEKTPIIPFAQGIKILADSGWTKDDGKPPQPDEDLSTPAELRLGQLIKEKYHTDYYILDKFPSSVRPFYTMLDPENPQVTNSFDIFLRGQEIVTGGQRIHDAEKLQARMKKLGVSTAGLEEYLEGFEYGAPPHAGCGIGLERLIMLLLNLGNIRFASLFPRDPKSLPARPVQLELRHPEASTSPPPWKQKPALTRRASETSHYKHEPDYQPLEKLIANYGDASNTSWLDQRYQVWRHPPTGAAIGYVPSRHDKFAIIVGNPLCASHQYSRVIHDFLRWLKYDGGKLKPIWILVDHHVEEILGGRLGWSTLTCAAEERINNANHIEYDKEVNRKIRHAKAEGIYITELPPGKPVPEELKQKCNERIKEWLANRKGKQIHLTNINPWLDPEHRRYFIAETKSEDGEYKIHALVALAQLSSEHGYQVKYSLDFPGAPSGTIEAIITYAIESVSGSGARSITFGAAASPEFVPVHGLKGMRVKLLSHSYKAIATRLRLVNKSEFREKLGAEQDPVYICYPPHGLGTLGVKAIMEFFSDED